MFCVETLPAATQGPSPAVFYVLPLEPSLLISLPFAVFMVKRKESKIMLLQPHCLLWAFEGHFHRAALMTTTEVPEQRVRGGFGCSCVLDSAMQRALHQHHPTKPS